MSLSKTIEVGNVKVGGDNPITIQSMTNTKTMDAISTVKQIQSLEELGCELIRVA
ncbi:MAG: flavodoxin-dependent (E)-4-hydroxy-3-methylbut-2-enyl-diphosphate synthase, partial [Neofamilia sp.]